METSNGLPTPRCTSRIVRNSPLPQLNWGDSNEIWDSMLNKDDSYNRDALLLIKNPLITAKMRSILLDWLSEVCEVFNLLRETYYFALDFIDRYLSIKNDVARQQLQLIGITCLFIAAKIEEVYPPKLKELAFVTDGACSELEIIQKELVIMETLNWSLHPVTVNKWLSIYMQLYSIVEKENTSASFDEPATGDQFLNPNYSTTFFFQIAHLVDLSMLDIGSIKFDYDMIAASAFYHFTSDEIVYTCTRYQLSDISECVIWMTPFALAIREAGFENPKPKSGSNYESWSNLQYHTVDLKLLEKAHSKRLDLQEEIYNDINVPLSPVSSPSVSKIKSSNKRKCDVNNNESSKRRKITISGQNIQSSPKKKSNCPKS